ncbi:MAG: hypothetical protein R3B09_09965 [Nannocystaceae bacterium]
MTPKLDASLEFERWPDPPPEPPPPAPPTAASLPEGAPGLVVINPGEVEIDLYTVLVVDAAGLLAPRVLWPHRYECKGRTHLRHPVPAGGGRFILPPPSRTYVPGECEPGPPLPDGDYVVLVDSGYGAELHAAAAITLPMRAPVELRIEPHVQAIPCTDALARRAVHLVVGASQAGRGRRPVPERIFDGCDLERPRCVTHGEAPARPPRRCDVTLFTHEHGALLRVSKPAGDDALSGLTAVLSHDIVYSRPPLVERTSSSAFKVAGGEVVISGTSTTHWHVHGGDGAKIGDVTLQVYNPLGRPVAYHVEGLEFLVDYGCGLPAKEEARPALLRAEPPDRLPPGQSELHLAYEAQEAYHGHCERFATRARLRVEGVTRAVTSEHGVGRFDPVD